MPKISATQFPEVFASLGVDLNNLGYIMLDVAPRPLELEKLGLDEDDYYYSPTREFVQGAVIDKVAHITLLGGLLVYGPQRKFAVDRVLEGWKKPFKLTVQSVGAFSSEDEDGAEYSAIVAHVDSPSLLDANNRLRLLPHIDNFPDFHAHVTIAYVKASATSEWVEAFSSVLTGKVVKTAELNYGS